MPFASMTTESSSAVLRELKTTRDGLSSLEAEARMKTHGPNELRNHVPTPWEIWFRQFRSPFIYLLFFAALISFALGDYIESAMIVLFVAINTTLAFYQEYQSHKALAMLRKFIKATSRVRRNGKDVMIDSREIVPGDLLIVQTGDIVPADLRIIEENSLMIDESILSGESAPVRKDAEAMKKPAHGIPDATNLAFSGTTVVGGTGLGVVYATGAKTEFGDIAKLTVETEHVSTFEKGLDKFSSFILRMIVLTIIAVYIANLLIKGPSVNPLQLLIFSIALAVSVIPEALPVVTTVSLSRGALRLAKNKVVVKRLSAIEDLGSIEILCADKTGTITENRLSVADVYPTASKASCLAYAALGSGFLGETTAQPNNAFDLAVWNQIPREQHAELKAYKKLSEIPFDATRRRSSVLVEHAGRRELIVRGAPESILHCCLRATEQESRGLMEWFKKEGLLGRRVIAIARKDVTGATYDEKKEHEGMTLAGAISFEDPIKPTTKQALTKAKRLGLLIKILTGDAVEVATAVAKNIALITSEDQVMTGDAFDALAPEAQQRAAMEHVVFARVSPEQKYKIIQSLQKTHEVGFLGEGINDAPALKIANVALVVQGASDIARDAADVVLLKKSLEVIVNGIHEGREVFANTVKYIKSTLASNFGNFYSVATASLILPFLPMLPIQILLVNLLSDFPMIAVSTDTVEPEELRRPRSYRVREVVLFATVLGLVSTTFDFIFFGLFYRAEPSVLQTNWFIESILTELVLIFSIRTKRVFFKAKSPSRVLLGLTGVALLATILVPFTSVGKTVFQFQPPTMMQLSTVIGIVVAYFILSEVVKLNYYKIFNEHRLGGK